MLDHLCNAQSEHEFVGKLLVLRDTCPESVVELYPELHVQLNFDGMSDAKLRGNQCINSDRQEAFR